VYKELSVVAEEVERGRGEPSCGHRGLPWAVNGGRRRAAAVAHEWWATTHHPPHLCHTSTASRLWPPPSFVHRLIYLLLFVFISNKCKKTLGKERETLPSSYLIKMQLIGKSLCRDMLLINRIEPSNHINKREEEDYNGNAA
jgi:hypothetical protein